MLADVSRPLRDEERQAWQRLIRVIGHEINNSLAPIKSIAGSLESMLARELTGSDAKPMSDPDVIDDMKRGLAVIAARSDSLSRFTTAYARLAKLPAPRLETVPRRPRWSANRRRRNPSAGPRSETGPDLDRSAPTPISSSNC